MKPGIFVLLKSLGASGGDGFPLPAGPGLHTPSPPASVFIRVHSWFVCMGSAHLCALALKVFGLVSAHVVTYHSGGRRKRVAAERAWGAGVIGAKFI